MADGYNTQFCEACSSFEIDSGETIGALEDISTRLAQSHELREHMGASNSSVWPNLRALWNSIVQKRTEEKDKGAHRRLCVALAKFTRNLVAGVQENQDMAFENEPDIRQMLHHYSSWSVMEEPETYTMTRILSQTLSNLVTSNEDLMSELWATYMTLTEDQAIILRLLALPDARTVLAVLVLILNCIHGSRERALMLCAADIGARICVSLLDGMVKLHDAEDNHGTSAFDVGYSIFTCLVEEGLVPFLYTRLSIQDEPITPHQTTLLKLLDSYLQSALMSHPHPLSNASSLTSPSLGPESPDEESPTASTRETLLMEICSELAPMLHGLFLELAKYAKGAIQRALGRDNEGANSTGTKNMATKAVGKRDAKVNHTATSKPSGAEDRASVWFEETDSSSGTEEFMNSKDLNLDGTSFTGRLAFDESRPLNDTTPRASIEDTTPRASTDTANRPGVHGDPLDRKLPPAELDALLPKVCEALVLVTQCIVTVCLEAEENPAMSGRDKLKDNFNENQVVGIVESLIELLRLLDELLPRINFGKPVVSSRNSTAPQLAATGFSYLKRDLVRLLGILCHERKAVQDSVRVCGGLEIVMNLCVVDERNPYIREHAIFTLRNLLIGNPENQAVVDAFQLTRDWDKESVFL